jgi:hypothetical protein
MTVKHWIPEALRGLAESLAPVPHEVNEIDWKAHLSVNSARLAEHLMAFAKHPGGGTLTPPNWARTPVIWRGTPVIWRGTPVIWRGTPVI